MYQLKGLVVHESKKILISLGLTYFMHKLLSHIKILGRKGVTVVDEE
jgi:hypothetical protein